MPAISAENTVVAYRRPVALQTHTGKRQQIKYCLERLKADIGIDDEQEQLWALFANVVRANDKRTHTRRILARIAAQNGLPSAPDAVDLAFGSLEDRLAALHAMRITGRRLYDALGPAQRRKADRLLPLCCLPANN